MNLITKELKLVQDNISENIQNNKEEWKLKEVSESSDSNEEDNSDNADIVPRGKILKEHEVYVKELFIPEINANPNILKI